MSPTWTEALLGGGLVLLSLALGELVARARSSGTAVLLAVLALVGMAALANLPGEAGVHHGATLIALLATATVLARPPAWREPRELGRLLSTALLMGLAFTTPDLSLVIAAWLASFLPGLGSREQAAVSRRPLFLLALLSGLPVLGGWLCLALPGPAWRLDAAWLLLVLGGAVRMGVPPFSPLLMANYDRLPMGRTALVAAARPSVALVLAARLALPEQVEAWAPLLQAGAAGAALLVALQGVVQRDPRRSIGAMAATQAAMILYGLVAPGASGVDGALIQWAGLGIALVGLGVLYEAVESRLGRTGARAARGLLTQAPGTALLFLLFAATMAGFPGTSGYAGEDLILQASASHGLWLRAVLVAATALNGATMLLLFARLFMGRLPPEARGFPRATLRERLVAGSLASVLGVLSVWPTLL